MSLLYQRFADQASRTPAVRALQASGRWLTMRGLVDLVDATARQFQDDGLGEGVFIGWLGHDTPEMLAALLACAKLGAVRCGAAELAAGRARAGGQRPPRRAVGAEGHARTG